MFSRRSHHDLTPNPISAALEQRRERGLPLLDLTISNPTTAAIPYRDDVVRALADPASLTYAPDPFGLPSARSEVARLYPVDVNPDQVILTCSTSEAYSYLFTLLCDDGDEVLVPAPSYPLFEHLAAYEGVRLIPYRLQYDGAWHLDVSTLRRLVTSRTRAILVVSPNNPTGSFLRINELRALSSLGLPIVSDEVFAAYPLDEAPGRMTTVLQEQGTLVFALGGLSKLVGLPQMKLGWMVVGGPRDVVTEAMGRLELLADSFLSVGTPVQLALPQLLTAGSATRDAISARLRRNLQLLRQRLRDTAASVMTVEGGWSAPIRLPRIRSDADWALLLLQREGVLVQPGYFYDFQQEAIVVVSLLTHEHTLDEGITRLSALLAQGQGYLT